MTTVTEAARSIGCSARTIRRHCQAAGLGRKVSARKIELSLDDIAELTRLVRSRPGNPLMSSPAWQKKQARLRDDNRHQRRACSW